MDCIKDRNLSKVTKAAEAVLVFIRYFAFFALLFTVFTSRAKAFEYASQYSAEIYNRSSGLGSSQVNTVCQTIDGYIWVGTYSGLYRYDGREFVRANIDERIRNVTVLLPNGRDGLWIGTNDAGLFYYYNATGQIRAYTASDGLESNSVRALCYGKNGELYIGTSSSLSILEEGTLSTYSSSDELYNVSGITCRADGTVAAVTRTGTVFIIENNLITKSFFNQSKTSYYTAVRYDSDGDLIIGSSDGKVYTGKATGSKLSIIETLDVSVLGSVTSIYDNRDGQIVVSGENGIGYYDDTDRFNYISFVEFNNSIGGVLEDRQGNLWATSSTMGLLKLSRNPFTDIISASGVGSRVVNAVMGDGNRLYVGCDEGLVILDKNDYEVVRDEYTDILSDVRIKHILKDSKGRLWFSTYGNEGLVCYDKNSVTTYNENKSGTQGSRFNCAIELTNGDIAVASTTGISIIRNDEVTACIGKADGLEAEEILCLYENEKGEIYAGSDGGGVYVIKNGVITGNIGTQQGLESLAISRIVKDGDRLFFVSGGGIYLYSDGECTALTNFPGSGNYDIIFARDGKAWITSGEGVYIVNKEDFASNGNYIAELLDSSKGLSASPVMGSWNYCEGDDIYLCCLTGVKKVSTEDYKLSDSDYEVAIREIVSDGTILKPDEDGIYHIPADAKRTSFIPCVLNYGLYNPLVKIYLEGFDDEALFLSQSELREISYTNLPYGSYTFHVQTLGSDMEVINESTAVIHKEARIYERKVFWAGVVIAAVLILMMILWTILERRNVRIIRLKNEQLKKAKEEAERISEYKTRFLASVSHEIRTPINTIMGMDELILREEVPAQVRQYAGDIYSSGGALLNIINDILDLSRIESGKMSIVPVEYSLSALLRELAGSLRMNADAAHLDSGFELDPRLPEHLTGDSNRIRQVVTNLLTNAVKYTREGSVTLKAELLSQTADTASIRFSVIDTGIGIKQEDMPKLFKEFERFDEERNHNIKGTGLGLSISRQLLELMGSKLEVESIYNEGSDFHFTVSQGISGEGTIGEIDLNTSESDAFESYKPAFTAPDASILVVDDTPLNLAVIRGLLRSTKVSIDTGESGLVALEKVKKNRYDLILLDHMMPEMDGIETLEQLRKMDHMCKGVPVVVLTANAIAGAKENYIKHGFDDYLSKPVSGKDLESLLLKFLPPSKIQAGEDEKSETGPDKVAGIANAGRPGESTQTEPVYRSLSLINPVKGINFCAGDKELYENVLEMFVAEFDEESRALQTFFEQRDQKKYVTHAHKLKSSGRTIGADSLFEKAKELEMAGKEENWEIIERRQGAVLQLYMDVVAEIKDKILVDRS